MIAALAFVVTLVFQTADAQIPETINFTATPDAGGGFVNPESLSYDAANERFFVSAGNGRIATVTHDGTYTEFAAAPTEVSSLGIPGNGIFVDAPRNRVMQVWSGFGAPNNTRGFLGIYDLTTGAQTSLIEVPSEATGASDTGRHFLNVIEVDDAGNTYVTDSFSPVVYQIDTSNNVSRFIDDAAAFGTDEGVVGAASLDLLDNRLFVGVGNSGRLFFRDVTDPAGSLSEVAITGTIDPAIDGMEFVDDNTLALMLNASSKIAFLETTDDWQTATVSNFEFNTPVGSSPTEGVNIDGNLHVIYSFFGRDFAAGMPGSDFTIQQIATVPEPSSALLLTAGALLVPLARRKRRGMC